jgi:SAM-dependent methyltransferase
MLFNLFKRPGSAFTTNDQGNGGFAVLRQKWCEVPFCRMDRIQSRDLLNFSDEDLLEAWTKALEDQTLGKNYDCRGWFYTLYRDQVRGKKFMDVGSGLGFDGLTFARAGAEVTFVDIVEDNLAIVKRMAKIFGLDNCTYHYFKDFDSLSALDCDYDFIWAAGSLINAPFEFTKAECGRLVEHLKLGGRWVELAYPKTRWEREGKLPFDRWGDKTDGGAPWIEWKDLTKIRSLLEPAQFNVVLHFEYHQSDFNWFDLERAA